MQGISPCPSAPLIQRSELVALEAAVSQCPTAAQASHGDSHQGHQATGSPSSVLSDRLWAEIQHKILRALIEWHSCHSPDICGVTHWARGCSLAVKENTPFYTFLIIHTYDGIKNRQGRWQDPLPCDHVKDLHSDSDLHHTGEGTL